MPGLKLFSEPDSRLVIDSTGELPEPPDLAEIRVLAFETELGFLAAEWRGGKLARLAFGHESPDEALEAIDRLGYESRRLAHVHRTLVARLRAYLRGNRDDFQDVPIWLEDITEFGRRVVKACRGIGYGQTLSYGQLAAQSGSPGAARAVGNVMATNRIPLIIPCHRVVASAGAIGGFSAPSGVGMKRRLLELEGAQ